MLRVDQQVMISAPRESVCAFLEDQEAMARCDQDLHALPRGLLRRKDGWADIRPISGGTVLRREELFELPFLIRPLGFLFRRRVDRALDSSLRLIKEGAEALNRRRQLQAVEAELVA